MKVLTVVSLICAAILAVALATVSAHAAEIGVLPALPDQTMDDSLMRVKFDHAKRVQSMALRRNKTSDDWRFGLPIGDGDFGAAIWGMPDKMHFDIGKNDITSRDRELDAYYPCMSFPDLRKNLAAGNDGPVWKAVQEGEKNYIGHCQECMAGSLTLDFLAGRSCSGYREELDFLSATATSFFTVDGKEVSVSSFASQTDQVMAIRSTIPGAFHGVLSRMPNEDAISTCAPRFSLEDGILYLRMNMPGGENDTRSAYVLALTCANGALIQETPQAASAFAFTVKPIGAASPVLYLTAVSNRDVRGPRADSRIAGQDSAAVARARLQNAIDHGHDAVRQEHLRWWQDFWNRSWVMMEEKKGEYPWYFSLYKAGSARRPGKIGSGYSAPWRGWDTLSWSGRFAFVYEQFSYNFGNLTSNHGEMQEPILGTLWHTREKFAKRTRDYFGMDGLCYPMNITNSGNIHYYKNTTLDVGSAGEAMQLMWDYYAFTQDKEFLRTIAYPLLRAVAEFYRHYLLEDEHKELYIFPSYYSELTQFHRDSITDQVIFRMTFDHAAQAADILGVDADKADAWRDARARLRPIKANSGGLWYGADPSYALYRKGTQWFDRSYLMLYPITIGELVNKWHGPDELRRQAEINYQHFLGKHPNEWSKDMAFIAGARMGDRGYYPAMLTNGAVENTEYGNITDSPMIPYYKRKKLSVDTASAFPAGVMNEFLLNSQFGEIRLFPAMPLTGHYAFHSLRARGAFLVSSEFRDGQVPYALVKSLAGNPCKMIQPFDKNAHVLVRELGTGKIVAEIPQAGIEQPIEFTTTTGQTYALERQDVRLENVPILDVKPGESALAR
jgi:hypothetical protein